MAEWNDVPYQSIRRDIARVRLLAEQYNVDHEKFVVFIHCREPEEIARFVKEYNATTVIIRRPQVESETQSNHADKGVFDYEYDVTVYNDNTIDHLKFAVDFFLDKLLKS